MSEGEALVLHQGIREREKGNLDIVGTGLDAPQPTITAGMELLKAV